ncbi:hypothetical protein [Pedobacter sp. V48]|uniref:hypothetical protein n=1 Tax=Pedobacter sp. V48 TaxID=509635 RepID=UPI0003E488C0|nr:hypothetical protein [Pedobacter sp. V48]ETZ20181.1 hypothetical protein N824_08185 [Pedobacter sp. V48]
MKYNDLLPINTTDKIDLLIDRFEHLANPDQLNKLEIEVMFHIRKLKIQFYFKERFQVFKDSLPVPKVPVATSAKKGSVSTYHSPSEKQLKGARAIVRELIGLSFSEIEKFTDLNCSTLERLLLKHEIEVTDETIFTSKMYELSKDYLTNAFAVKNRASKLSKIEEESISSGYTKRNYKFAPSLGKEGNYHKLIFIRPKS